MGLTFEWDEEKARINLRKHKVGFEEACTVFDDPRSITIPDVEHSASENRYVDIGTSAQQRVLVVVYTERGSNVRIISCRRAASREQRIYEEKTFQEE
jgi:uncharacterized protein